ncbi:MAG TPA: 2-hydroxymuconate tautomerase [Terriglobales bacterium]|nr:2-hydroxymuconate tautomerase [Terriglobales bacterium]
MPHVQITMLEGRTTEQKRKVAERITQVLQEEIGTQREGISISIVEVAKDCYARGGVLMCDKNK